MWPFRLRADKENPRRLEMRARRGHGEKAGLSAPSLWRRGRRPRPRVSEARGKNRHTAAAAGAGVTTARRREATTRRTPPRPRALAAAWNQRLLLPVLQLMIPRRFPKSKPPGVNPAALASAIVSGGWGDYDRRRAS
jgi:hypothetical protein